MGNEKLSDKENREFFAKLKDWLIPLFLLSGLLSLAYTTTIRTHYGIILPIEIALLTFVSIFYPLVIQKNILEKKKELITFYRTQFINNVGNSLKKIKKAKENDYDIISDETIKIREESDNLTTFHRQINIKNILFRCVIAFLISTLLLIEDLIFLPKPLILNDAMLYYLAQPGYILFWYGFYKAIMLIYSWNSIINKE